MTKGALAAPLAAAAALLLTAGAWFAGWPDLSRAVVALYGFPPAAYPFLDTEASLSAWECARKGFDVIAINPCDILGRPYNYAPFWIDLQFIPLGNSHRVAVGLILDIAFLLSLLTLAVPATRANVAIMAAAGLSTSMAFALERANTDLLLFLGVLATVRLLQCGPAARWLAYVLVWLMTAIKYYPAVLLVLAARERRAMLAAIAAISAALLALFVARYHADAARAMALVPSGPPDVLLFGAKNLPIFLGQLAGGSLQVSILAQLVLVILCLRLAMGWRRDADLLAALDGIAERSRLLLIAGSALLLGCFFATQNIVYRGIYFLPVLHGLLTMAAAAPKPETASLCRANAVIIVLLMSADMIRFVLLAMLPDALGPVAHAALVLVRELAWWWVIALMGGFVLDFLSRTEIGRGLLPRPKAV